ITLRPAAALFIGALGPTRRAFCAVARSVSGPCALASGWGPAWPALPAVRSDRSSEPTTPARPAGTKPALPHLFKSLFLLGRQDLIHPGANVGIQIVNLFHLLLRQLQTLAGKWRENGRRSAASWTSAFRGA